MDEMAYIVTLIDMCAYVLIYLCVLEISNVVENVKISEEGDQARSVVHPNRA